MTASSSPRVILTALGSRGDVHPLLALADQLQLQGARPVVLLAENYLPLAQQMGLESASVITREEFQATIANADLWHHFRGPRLLVRDLMVARLPRLLAKIEALIEPGNSILVAHPRDLAARVLRDQYSELRLLSVHLAPVAFRSRVTPPRLTGGLYDLRRPIAPFQLLLADRLLVDPWLTRPLNEIRRSRGLGPVRRPLQDWFYSPDGVLCFYPDWFGPVDLPAHFRCVGFPRFDGPQQAASDTVDRILSEFSESPVVFTPGSAHVRAEAFFQAAIEACRKLKIAGLMLTTKPEQVSQDRPPHVRVARYAPLGELLPRCRAIVHHGGIGTTSQALAAGIPQLICPMAFDQFDNARRIIKLGVGQELFMRRLNPQRLTDQLSRLLVESYTVAKIPAVETPERVCRRAAEFVLAAAKHVS